MTNEEIQQIMNSTFGGLAVFCRDINLDERLISKYQPNQIIKERGFTDVTYRIGGMTTNCRYLVASSQGKDLSMFNPNSKQYGHILIKSDSYFKVLDIQKEDSKTQILLLNIPEEGVQIFGSSKINIEDQIIEKGIELFKKGIESEPIPELQSEDWIERTSLPLGMSQEGEFFFDKQNQNVSNPSKELKETKLKQDKPQPQKKVNKHKNEKKGFWNRLFRK